MIEVQNYAGIRDGNSDCLRIDDEPTERDIFDCLQSSAQARWDKDWMPVLPTECWYHDIFAARFEYSLNRIASDKGSIDVGEENPAIIAGLKTSG